MGQLAIDIGRREFIATLGGTAVARPLAAQAQQQPMRVIGFLNSPSPDESDGVVAAFRQGLAESGFVEGRNIAIEYRWTHGQYDRLPTAADLVSRQVPVTFAGGTDVRIRASRELRQTAASNVANVHA